MSIETIIQSWKSDEDTEWAHPSPVGVELSDQELQEISGGTDPVDTIIVTVTIAVTLTLTIPIPRPKLP